ncbi:Glucose dehydrogenase [FAD, quinone] [Orchesella cincta]|uniref:Glucose dehydrogenase [FAD, quinone] n=1 Tax=Orchesella cincta TaxID=48709 RepID=A0A1D2M803_ORCCI|nr:Glucose dehydrogenase [FAD, quinone] [Orchesella cincta]
MVETLTNTPCCLDFAASKCVVNVDLCYLVGGGTGGLAVARRLAEDGRHTVLVLESGGIPKEGNEIPALAPGFTSDSDIIFRYTSVPQQNAALSTDGLERIISGRMLGGTSSLNYMHFNRGSPRDYDAWAESTGDQSWKYSNMLPYLKRIETYAGDYPSDQHGYFGPVMLSRPKYAPGLDYWLEAGKSLGYQTRVDPNGPQKISKRTELNYCPLKELIVNLDTRFTATEFSKRLGRRDSSYTAYIQPILSSTPNLRVLTNVNATQIMFSGKHAVGVKFDSNIQNSYSTDNVVYAKKEIIISAGSYGSPVLLMRSGIGPREVLEAAKIPILQELPVGKNLQNHIALELDFLINDTSAVIHPPRDFTPENLELFNRTGDGPYSSAGGATGQAFIASSVAKAAGESDWADIQFTMAHSVKEVLRVMETESYQRLGARFDSIEIPACMNFQMKSDEFLACYIKHLSHNGCHPVGTCKMGPSRPFCCVIGIHGLRIADASVMPSIVNANTQVAVYAIAERVSELILQQWQQQSSFRQKSWHHGQSQFGGQSWQRFSFGRKHFPSYF